MTHCFLILALTVCATTQGVSDEDRRKKFLEGASAADARGLVESKKTKNIDAVAAFFRDKAKPYKQRLIALKALRLLHKQNPKEYKRVYLLVKADLALEASRGQGMSRLNQAEEGMLLEALHWHADMKYEHAMFVLEHYVDTDINQMRRIKLSILIRVTAAQLLVCYAPKVSGRQALWGVLREAKENDALRQVCFDSLKKFMKDRKERVLALKPAPKDEWLLRLQLKLHKQK